MIQIFGLTKIPLVKQGDKIGDQIVKAAKEEGIVTAQEYIRLRGALASEM